MLNIAHRGWSKRFPDNTLEAFEAAMELGVDGIECDVQETSDGRFVVYHEPTLQGAEVGRLSLEQVQDAKLEGEYRIPTLEETLERCIGPTRMMLDLHSIRSVQRFLAVVRARTNPEDVAIGSFDSRLIAKVAELAPELRRGLITDVPPGGLEKVLESVGGQGIGVRFPHASAERIRGIRRAGYLAFVWGSESEEEVIAAMGMRPDGIVSDFPQTVKEELIRQEGES